MSDIQIGIKKNGSAVKRPNPLAASTMINNNKVSKKDEEQTTSAPKEELKDTNNSDVKKAELPKQKEICHIPLQCFLGDKGKEMLRKCLIVPENVTKKPNTVDTFKIYFKFKEFMKHFPEYFTSDAPITIKPMSVLTFKIPTTVCPFGYSPYFDSRGKKWSHKLNINVNVENFRNLEKGQLFRDAMNNLYDVMIDHFMFERKASFPFRLEKVESIKDEKDPVEREHKEKNQLRKIMGSFIKEDEDKPQYPEKISIKINPVYANPKTGQEADSTICMVDVWQKKSKKEREEDIEKFKTNPENTELLWKASFMTDRLSIENSTGKDDKGNEFKHPKEQIIIGNNQEVSCLAMFESGYCNTAVSKDFTVGGFTLRTENIFLAAPIESSDDSPSNKIKKPKTIPI